MLAGLRGWSRQLERAGEDDRVWFIKNIQVYELKKQNLRAPTAGDATLGEIDIRSAKSHRSGFLNCSSIRSFYITSVSHDIYYRTGQEILEQIGTPAMSTKLTPTNEICDMHMLTTFAYDYRESRGTLEFPQGAW